MVHTVGIVGVTGNIGAPTAKALIAAAEQDKIKVVIFHRASTNLSGLNKGPNVDFRILNFDDPLEKIEEALKGVNVFFSAVGLDGIANEGNVVDALAKSSDIITYIPSTLSTTWEAEDHESELIGPMLKFVHGAWDRAVEKGVPVTPIYTGVFDIFWFEKGFIIPAVKENTIWANKQQLKNPFPISHAEHIAQAVVRIATSDPDKIKNKEYSVVTFWPTGQELADLYGKINGKPAHIKDYTEAERDALVKSGTSLAAAQVGYKDKWTNNSWKYESNGRTLDSDFDGPSLEEVVRRYASA